MTSPANVHHVKFYVTNAQQAAYWYCCSFGFHRFAQSRRHPRAIAVRNGTIVLVFVSYSAEQANLLLTHGDFVQDVAFRVDQLSVFEKYVAEYKLSVVSPRQKISDDHGWIEQFTLLSLNSDLRHSLIDDSNYEGLFLPGYAPVDNFSLCNMLLPVPMLLLDHVVQAYPLDGMEDSAEWYRISMKLQRFWSVDDQIGDFEFTAINARLLTNEDHKVQMTLAEPSPNRPGKSQIEEFVDFNGGPGIQHMALLVEDIIFTIKEMKNRSVEFLTVPVTYYDVIAERLKESNIKIAEDIEKLRELSILIDFDDSGYLLQIFTKPCQDRPTLFVEIIQRRNFKGFGAGNFKALFEAVEREQKLRGTLYDR